MTNPSPDPTSSGGGSAPSGRVALWVFLALCLVAGVILYFRFGTDVAPLRGAGR
jgi:hypothetical protein